MTDQSITKTAVITGSVSGIGLALTQHLLSEGENNSSNVHWRVVMADINESAYKEVRPTLKEDFHIFVRTDVSKFEDQLLLFKRAFEWSGGRIDLFANNAGIPDQQPLLSWLGQPGSVEIGDPSEPNLSCIDVDLKAGLYGLTCFVHFARKTRKLIAQRTAETLADMRTFNGDHTFGVKAAEDFHPKMVVTASMAGIYPFYILPIYTAAKHGCIGFVRAAAPTLFEDEEITLNAIMPSTTRTNIIPKTILEQWPEGNFTPLETIIRAFDELTSIDGRIAPDGLSDGQDGMLKNGCCVEALTNRLFYRDPVSFPNQVQEWVVEQSRRDGILGKFMQSVVQARRAATA